MRAPPPVHQAVPIEHRVDGADGRTVGQVRHLLAELLADLRCAPARVLALQPDNPGLDGGRHLVGLPLRPPAAIRQALNPAVLVPVVNLVASLPGDSELRTQGRHLLALQQAGDKPEALVHDVTLLPGHAPSCKGARVSPMCPEYGVTYLSGRTQHTGRR